MRLPAGATPPTPAPGAQPAVQPLAQAHAHNDDEHDRPLLDALDHGFTSVEADVHLVGTELLVAHDPEDIDPGRTLQSLYLDPLAERAHADDGTVHPGYDGVFQLLIDIRTEPVATYLRLHEVLAGYSDGLTRFVTTEDGHRAREGSVTAVVSANRPVDLMARQPVRYAGYDGRPADLTRERTRPAARVPTPGATPTDLDGPPDQGPAGPLREHAVAAVAGLV